MNAAAGPGRRRHRGFTIVELLAVIAIIALLGGLVLAGVQGMREAAGRRACQNNLRQVGAALHGFHDVRRTLPPGYVSGFDADGNDTGPGWGWASFILAYSEQDAVQSRIDRTRPIEAARNTAARTEVVRGFLCPADSPPAPVFEVGPRDATGSLTATTCSVAFASYVGNFGVSEPGVDGEGVFYRDSRVSFQDITDGLSNTLMIGERSFAVAEATWVGAVTNANLAPAVGSPMALQVNNASNFVLGHTGESFTGADGATEINNFTSRHLRGCNYTFADGHVGFLGGGIDYPAFKALSTRARGDDTEED